jgi:hypothetical protein
MFGNYHFQKYQVMLSTCADMLVSGSIILISPSAGGGCRVITGAIYLLFYTCIFNLFSLEICATVNEEASKFIRLCNSLMLAMLT